MNYNHFTINYIEAIKLHLKIEIVNGEIIFIPDYILPQDILNLKIALENIWESSESAILLIKNKHDSKIQSGLFGLVNNFDLAVRTGFLLGDRVILIDYIFERILKNKSIDKININVLGSIGANLVSLLELAKKGRFVIIPSPFYWNLESKKIMIEVGEKVIPSPELMSLLNMLSITKICKLHPFTIAESEENYQSIINTQLDFVDEIGKDGGKYAYEGILGSLLTEKLLNEVEFKTTLDIPLEEFYQIANSESSFYREYATFITSGGSLSGEDNIELIKNSLLRSINETNKTFLSSPIKKIGSAGGIGSGIISILGSFSTISPTLAFIGALSGFSSTLTGTIEDDGTNEKPIISVFKTMVKK